jgi:hypothetical protein
MKRHLAQFLFLVSALAFTIEARADDRWETLRAINWVENPTNHTRAGKFGEMGPYQFRSGTWRMHTRRPFSQATQREAADEVAVLHYEWIKSNLEKAGVDASPFNIAMAWNSGVNNVIKGRAPSVSYNYAQRVVNLVHTFKEQQPQKSPVLAHEPELVAAVTPVVIPSLDRAIVSFSLVLDAPKFEVVTAPPAPLPTVFTDRTPAPEAPEKPLFIVATTATLTPNFSLIPSLTN